MRKLALQPYSAFTVCCLLISVLCTLFSDSYSLSPWSLFFLSALYAR